MRVVNIHTAKTHLSRLVNEAAAGVVSQAKLAAGSHDEQVG